MKAAPLSKSFLRAAPLVAGLLFLAGCRSTPEEREAKRMAQGKAYLAKKNYKSAVIEFKVASQNAPKDARAMTEAEFSAELAKYNVRL